MLAENDKYIHEASETIYQLTQDEHIRRLCEAREDFYRRERSVSHKLQKNQETIADLNAKFSKASAELEASKNEIEKLKSLLQQHNIPINE